MIDAIDKVGVVGLGVMGFDIAFLYAMRGWQTLVFDTSKAAMDALTGRSEQTIERLKKRNRIADGAIENIRGRLILAEINYEMPEVSFNPPQLLTTMAGEGETFYKSDQPNAWLLSQVKSPNAYARH